MVYEITGRKFTNFHSVAVILGTNSLVTMSNNSVLPFITEGIVQRPPFNITSDLKFRA